jgi:hypothetical protein
MRARCACLVNKPATLTLAACYTHQAAETLTSALKLLGGTVELTKIAARVSMLPAPLHTVDTEAAAPPMRGAEEADTGLLAAPTGAGACMARVPPGAAPTPLVATTDAAARAATAPARRIAAQ